MASRAEAVTNLLNHLRQALGTGENPPGSNSNFIVDWYNRTVERIGNGAWCEMTATWAMWTSGYKSLKTGRAYTVWAAQDAQQNKDGMTWHWGTAGMLAGDQVYYDWGGAKGDVGRVDHTGIVEQIVGDGTFYALEGNVSNKLLRTRRDSKFVVGYIRPDWSRVATATDTPPAPAPKPAAKPTPDRAKTKRIQTLLNVPADGMWGPNTDGRALFMRAAAQGNIGNVRQAQSIVKTPVDGIWGPNSKAALRTWVRSFQAILGVVSDGVWGPITDNAFLTVRKQNLNNY